MKNLPFKVGDEIKNYKEMCALLNEKTRTGGSKISQLNRWKEYFEWENKGYKFIITKILNNNYPTHDNNGAQQSHKIFERVTFYGDTESEGILNCKIMERHMWDKNFQNIYWSFVDYWLDGTKLKYHWVKGLFYTLYGYHEELTKTTFHSLLHTLRLHPSLSTEKEHLLKKLIAEHESRNIYKKIKNKNATHEESIECIYKFTNEQGMVLYIGKTKDLMSRLATHFSSIGHLPQECYDNIAQISYLETDSQMLNTILEIYFIAKYFPKYNSRQKYKGYTPIADWNNMEWKIFKEFKTIKLPYGSNANFPKV